MSNTNTKTKTNIKTKTNTNIETKANTNIETKTFTNIKKNTCVASRSTIWFWVIKCLDSAANISSRRLFT